MIDCFDSCGSPHTVQGQPEKVVKVDTKVNAIPFLPSKKKRGYRVCSSGYAATDTS
jgi:hypothetical protein